MPSFTVKYDFYNPNNPKCRNCAWLRDFQTGVDRYSTQGGTCANANSNQCGSFRNHNDKACVSLQIKETYEKQRERCIGKGLCDPEGIGNGQCGLLDDKIISACDRTACPLNLIPPTRYYVENVQRGKVGNCMQWWKSGDRGYTCNLDEARTFREDELAAIIREDGKYRAWPVHIIEDAACRHVNFQALDCDCPGTKYKGERK